MPKTIYTGSDIEDLARSGAKELAVTDNAYLTDLARERAEKLGIALRATSASTGVSEQHPIPRENTDQLVAEVKDEVIAKLGGQVDAAIIERIVRRVVSQL